VPVSAVAGLAGVGKTTLAIAAAHAAVRSGWYPGGVLFVDLHGYDKPVEPAQTLDALLRALRVPAAAGRYGFAAVGAHHQVIAVRDVVMAAGESFAITRAIMAELYPDGQLLSYQGNNPETFRHQATTQLGLDPADDGRWEPARQFRCPARMLDVLLANYENWALRQADDN
jgi:hypothetical protein